MATLVSPKVYLWGFPEAYIPGIEEYLRDTDQEEFMVEWWQAKHKGLSDAECLCSLYSKLCYKTLVEGKNANVQKVRGIEGNVRGTLDQAHGAVFEHANINFNVANCSRVYTHEQVRHRVGVAYSQTSGRYCRLDQIGLVWDPILDPVKERGLDHLRRTEELVYLMECDLGLRKPNPKRPEAPKDQWVRARHYVNGPGDGPDPDAEDYKWVPDFEFDFNRRKKITSAIRRFAPNGQENEMGMTLNVRALRHLVQLRTAPSAEYEIRSIYGQIYTITKRHFPLLYHGAREREEDGLLHVYGMRTQPYEIIPGDPEALELWSTEDLRAELLKREVCT